MLMFVHGVHAKNVNMINQKSELNNYLVKKLSNNQHQG
ncbi:MAG: hypothetical protein JWP37_2003 [Mucilaginibacter sp.]|nr:hypothetical protein [Mucilaginibacter sp.]